jgi:hypothetical protein
MLSFGNHNIFIAQIKRPWSELSHGILVVIWVQKLTPNHPISYRDPVIASSIIFFCVPHKNLQRHQPTPPGTETIPLICSWFDLSVHMVTAQGVAGWCVVSWRHNTMSSWLQEGWIGGGCFHLLQAPFGATVAKKHHSHAASWSSVAAGAVQAPYWLLPLQQWQSCQCNALMMHFALNSLINTINDNKF